MAGAVAAAGDHDRARALATDAEQLARSLTHPDLQAQTLTALAGLAEPARARSLIANALSAGRWTIPLHALAHVDSVALSVFVDECAPLRLERPVPLDNGPLSGTSAVT